MTDLLCRVLLFTVVADCSWKSFKLLKRRDRINRDLVYLVSQTTKDEKTISFGEQIKHEADEGHEELGLRFQAYMIRVELKKILKFWVVYAFFMFYQTFFERFISWFPIYYVFKFVLLVLLISSKVHFTEMIFHNFIQPQLEKQLLFMNKKLKPEIRKKTILLQSNALYFISSFVTNWGSDDHLQKYKEQLVKLQLLAEKEQKNRKTKSLNLSFMNSPSASLQKIVDSTEGHSPKVDAMIKKSQQASKDNTINPNYRLHFLPDNIDGGYNYEKREDIPSIYSSFIDEYSKRMKKAGSDDITLDTCDTSNNLNSNSTKEFLIDETARNESKGEEF